jgi:hypothetical protein
VAGDGAHVLTVGAVLISCHLPPIIQETMRAYRNADATSRSRMLYL